MGGLILPLIPLAGGGSVRCPEPHSGPGFHPPSVDDFKFCGGFVPGVEWINKPFVQAVIAAILVIVLWWIASSKLKVVPGKGQFLAEYVYDFIRNGVARDILGPEFRRYLPFLLALFSFLLVNNWFGEFFLFMMPTFSNVGYAYGFAILVWLLYVGAGIRKHGFGHFMKKSLIPEGVPWYLLWLIIPLEFLSNFITRPITLALRLFANMFAGHLTVVVFVVGGWFLMTYPMQSASTDIVPFFNVAGLVSVLFSFAILLLEIFIGGLQAYIFTVLTAQYVSSSLADDH